MIWGGTSVIIIIEIKCTINAVNLNHPETISPHPGLWKICLPWNWSLGTAALGDRKKETMETRWGKWTLYATLQHIKTKDARQDSECLIAKWSESHSVMSDSLRPHGLYSPWSFPGQNTGVGSLSLLQGSSQPRDWTQVFCIAGGFFTSQATREVQWRGRKHISKCWSRIGGMKPLTLLGTVRETAKGFIIL